MKVWYGGLLAIIAIRRMRVWQHDPAVNCYGCNAAVAETQAVEFLTREVPAWSKENGCFSCHNNGDAARALYVASRKGYRVPATALADTTAWVATPNRWEHNKGNPGFGDKRLADVQFAAALLAAFETGHLTAREPLEQAARKLVADQHSDGAWHIDTGQHAWFACHLRYAAGNLAGAAHTEKSQPR
jgi:hypothetical protein